MITPDATLTSSGFRTDQKTVAPTFPFTTPRPLEVFAVDDNSAQVVWRTLGRGTLIARIDDRAIALGDAAATGAASLTELMPDRDHTIKLSVDDRPIGNLSVRTAPCLGMGPSTKIATIGDIHLGELGFGLVKRMNERGSTTEPYPIRCASAAVAEALEWGADLLVIKGDITDAGLADQWAEFDRLLERITVPVVAIPGNHDVGNGRHSLAGVEQLQQRGLCSSSIQVIDNASARVVVLDSTVPGRGFGRISPLAPELETVVAVDRPVVIFTHHHFHTTALPWFWPLGTTRRDGYGTLDRLIDVNPDIFLSSGHTHRNRARHHRSAVLTEVGSVKDHPGVWAGYELTHLGIRQTTRRVSRPDCIAWTERTRAVVGGMWGRWSPGQMGDRCVTHHWTRQREERDVRRTSTA